MAVLIKAGYFIMQDENNCAKIELYTSTHNTLRQPIKQASITSAIYLFIIKIIDIEVPLVYRNAATVAYEIPFLLIV